MQRILYLSYIHLVLQVPKGNAYIGGYIVYASMTCDIFNYKPKIFIGVLLTSVGLPDIVILFMDLLLMERQLLLQGVPNYPDFSRF